MQSHLNKNNAHITPATAANSSSLLPLPLLFDAQRINTMVIAKHRSECTMDSSVAN